MISHRAEISAHHEQAMVHFTRAAASLTEPGRDGALFALHEGALGMLEMAKADPDMEVADRYLAILDQVARERRAPEGLFAGSNYTRLARQIAQRGERSPS